MCFVSSSCSTWLWCMSVNMDSFISLFCLASSLIVCFISWLCLVSWSTAAFIISPPVLDFTVFGSWNHRVNYQFSIWHYTTDIHFSGTSVSHLWHYCLFARFQTIYCMWGLSLQQVSARAFSFSIVPTHYRAAFATLKSRSWVQFWLVRNVVHTTLIFGCSAIYSWISRKPIYLIVNYKYGSLISRPHQGLQYA